MGCGKRLANCALSLVVVVLLAFGALYYWVLPRIDGLLEDALHRELMLAPSSTVEVTRGSLLDTLEGQVDRLVVEADEARIDRMVVEDLTFRAEDIQFDLIKTLTTGRADLKDVTRAELHATVTEDSLRERWTEELSRKGLKQADVKLEDDRVEVSGVVNLGITKVRISARGNVLVEHADRVKFHVAELDVAGTTLGIEQWKADFSTLTPVIDLGQLQLGVMIDSVEVGDGYIKIKARSASLEERVAAAEEQAKATDDESDEGSRWRVPSLDEVLKLVKEPEPEPEAEDASEEDNGAVEDEDKPEDSDSVGTEDTDERSEADAGAGGEE